MASNCEMIGGPAAVADEQSRTLILGASSGKSSALEAQHYAGHGNVFWQVMGDILGFSPKLPYLQRIARLRNRGIAIWNVYGMGFNARAFPVVNDFVLFFKSHPRIALILFNGKEAGRVYNHRVRPRLPNAQFGIRSLVLPSTNPLHSSISYVDKLSEWRAAFDRERFACNCTK